MNLEIIVLGALHKSFNRLKHNLKDEAQFHEKFSTDWDDSYSQEENNGSLISVRQSRTNCSKSDIENLPYCEIRVFLAHGSLNYDKQYSMDFFHNISSHGVLSLFKDKQQVIFLLSCHAGAIHANNQLSAALGNSILVTCIDGRFISTDSYDDEISLYISKLTKKNIDLKLIILAVISRFPTTITVKMPGKESVSFGSTLNQHNKELVQETVRNAAQYMEIDAIDDFFTEELCNNYSRYEELQFDTRMANWGRLTLQERETLRWQLEKAPPSLLNRIHDIDGNTLLSYILEIKHLPIQEKIQLANLLIIAGTDLNTIGHQGDIVLIKAMCFTKNISFVKRLIEAGANPNIKSTLDGASLLHITMDFIENENEVLDFLYYLLSYGFDLNTVQNDGTSLLHSALRNNLIKIAEILLEMNIHVSSYNHEGITPLFIAIDYNYVEIAKILMSKNVNVNHPLKSGLTCLHVSTHNPELVQLLLGAGANIHAESNSGETALFFASEENHAETIVTLARNNADMNHPDQEGATPLHIAVKRGHHEAMQILIENGALINSIDKKGNTPMFYAKQNYDKQAQTILISANQSNLTSNNNAFFANKENGFLSSVQLQEIMSVDMTRN